MKKIGLGVIGAGVIALGVSLFAGSDLGDKAKAAGLVAIPTEKGALEKMIGNAENPLSAEKIELGKMLYFEPRLSKSGLISCNTCHNLGLGGTDGVSAAVGHKWTSNPHHLNSPTVYNSVFNGSQMWDGRFKDLEEQAGGPVQAGPEMASSKELVESRLKSIPEYKMRFNKVFGSVTFENMQNAIAAFERTLVTPAPYDAFLNGKSGAIQANAKAGMGIFIDKGCTSCHTGVALGGSMQPFPAVKPYKYADIGDFKGNKDGKVKVPTLRNITETAPYFHNGTVWDLKEAVAIMGETQLGITLSDDEKEKIVAFLKSLSGKKPVVTYPVLPASTVMTKQPDIN